MAAAAPLTFPSDAPAAYRDGDVLLASRRWLAGLLNHGKKPFLRHPSLSDEEVASLLRRRRTPAPEAEWNLLLLERLSLKPDVKVKALARKEKQCNSNEDHDDLCFSDAIRDVAEKNFSNLWRNAHLTRSGGGEEGESCRTTSHDEALWEVLKRLHPDCPVIGEGTGDRSCKSTDEVTNDHILAVLAIVKEPDALILVRPYSQFSVQHALAFSPSLLAESSTKCLFVVYQLLRAFRRINSEGLCVGDVTLRNVALNSRFFVTLHPNVRTNLEEVKLGKEDRVTDPLYQQLSLLLKSLMSSNGDSTAARNLETDEPLSETFLGEVVHLWRFGKLSNFEYLLFLNYLSGRTFVNPDHYPVMPWVRDFSSIDGGWRDLTKSKFRLNKGDTQLDLTFNSFSSDSDQQQTHSGLVQDHSAQAPHHVTDVLSEITYYVYKSRRTPRSVLCKHVRQQWVPAEYPSSMARLQQWTPDECIPDFFWDPSIFVSLHDDLPDLDIPSFCVGGPEEFVKWHRESLESNYVSERLHHWIDLTFGCKLTGSSAAKAKNVCLSLVDGHTDLRLNGVVQLFNHSHPRKVSTTRSQFWSRQAPYIRESSFLLEPDDAEKDSESTKNEIVTKETIFTPKEFDALEKLKDLESYQMFLSKSLLSTRNFDASSSPLLGKKFINKLSADIPRDMRVLGCLILELFLPKRFSCLGRFADLESRLAIGSAIIKHEAYAIPSCIRQTVENLIKQEEMESQVVNSKGLPPSSAFQLLVPQLSSLILPRYFQVFARILRTVVDLEQVMDTSVSAMDDHEAKMAIEQKVGEFKVKLVASELQQVQAELNATDVQLLLPLVKDLFADPCTAIMAAWHLLDLVASILGRELTTKHLLLSVLGIYESNTLTSKHLKLYHRSFLQVLIIRFGTQTFLRYFSTFLVEAVGGYKDYEDEDKERQQGRQGLEREWLTSDSQSRPNSRTSVSPEHDDTNMSRTICDENIKSPCRKSPTDETFAEGEVFAFDTLGLDETEDGADTIKTDKARPNNKRKVTSDQIYIPPVTIYDFESDDAAERSGSQKRTSNTAGNISQVAAESALWLTHRIGPVLTAKHITRNLLRMLNLCYSVPGSSTVAECFPDQKIRLSPRRIHGDVLSQRVLECLAEAAALYGDHMILLQYFPYAWDLLSLARKRMTANLEGGLLGCVEMIHHIVPYLSDSLLMNELPDNLLANVLFPVLRLMTSRSFTFNGGFKTRRTLVFKFLDLVYLIGLRIGEEMCRSHLTSLCGAFFSTFDKVYNSEGELLKIVGESAESRAVSLELAASLTPEVAFSAYVAFYNLMGRAHLDASIMNLDVIRTLCLTRQESGERLPRPATFTCLRTFPKVPSSGGEVESGGSGAAAVVTTSAGNSLNAAVPAAVNDDLHSLISKDSSYSGSSSERYLRGNWLAYWEHEIGRSDSDAHFNLKQIKLQSFVGHSAAVKYIFAMNNENSFLSASRDKTVKVWSLRSQGDGTAAVSSQWTYGLHKRSVFSVLYLEAVKLAASCDGTIHVWDPFVGAGVHQVDPQRLGQAVVVARLSLSSSPLLLAATQDSLLHLVDTRVGTVVTDLKVSMGSAGLVRTLCSSLDGNNVYVGHSSGSLSVLDLRTGKLKQAWKGHEGEVLSLTPVGPNEFVSTSLDQTSCVWNAMDGKLRCSLAGGTQEPVTCVAYLDCSNDLVTGTTSNKVTVRHGIAADAPHFSHKLRSDLIKGSLSSLRVLPMNRMMLIGTDNGGVTLLC